MPRTYKRSLLDPKPDYYLVGYNLGNIQSKPIKSIVQARKFALMLWREFPHDSRGQLLHPSVIECIVMGGGRIMATEIGYIDANGKAEVADCYYDIYEKKCNVLNKNGTLGRKLPLDRNMKLPGGE